MSDEIAGLFFSPRDGVTPGTLWKEPNIEQLVDRVELVTEETVWEELDNREELVMFLGDEQ